MATRTVSVELRAKVDQYVSGMKKAEAATKAGSKAAAANRKENELMGKAAKLVGGIVAVQFARRIITAASDLNETVSKSTVVFGKNAASVQKWAKTSATAFGMSENAALGAASTYGNLFVSLGLTEDASASMSTKLVELAGDLASFNNVSPEEALDALRSGLVGETEPLKRFGINMNEATLKAQAMKMGLISTTKEALDPAVKAQAAYALILGQSTTAQGDFARTSDGLANQQRILNAEWENAQASLGQTLLPAMTKAVSVLADMLAAFNGLPQPVKSTALAVAAVSAALLVAAPRIAATKAALLELGIAGGKGRKGMLGLGKALGLLVAFQVAGAAVEAFGDKLINAGRTTNELESDLRRLAMGQADVALGFTTAAGTVGDLNEALKQAGNVSFLDELASNIAPVQQEFEYAREAVAGVDAALASMVNGGSADLAAEAFQRLRDSFIASGGAAEDFDAQFVAYRDSLAGVANETAKASGETDGLGSSADKAKEKVDDLKTALDKLRGASQSTAEANANLEQAFDDAREAAAELKGGLNKTRTAFDLNTQAGRDGQDALFGIIDAAYDTAEAMGAAGASTGAIRERTMDARLEFIKTAEKMGLTKDAARDLADKYGLIPKRIATKVSVNRAAALAAVEDVKAAIASIPAVKNVKIDIRAGTQGTGGGRRTTDAAAGGHIRGPGSGTSDSIPARLSNGEYVVRAKSVRKYGTRMLGAINEGRYANGGPVGFALGGYASTGSTGATSSSTMLGFDQATRPIVLRVDSVQVWKGLLALKRGNGGASLGLG